MVAIFDHVDLANHGVASDEEQNNSATNGNLHLPPTGHLEFFSLKETEEEARSY